MPELPKTTKWRFDPEDTMEKISVSCGKAGTPPPIFKTDICGVTLIFQEPEWLREVAPEASRRDITQPLGKGLGKVAEATRERIVQTMHDNPSITTSMLAEMLGISTTAVEKHIRAMREVGRIRQVGARSSGYWEVLKC